jgi:hypothetical protein
MGEVERHAHSGHAHAKGNTCHVCKGTHVHVCEPAVQAQIVPHGLIVMQQGFLGRGISDVPIHLWCPNSCGEWETLVKMVGMW